MKFSFLAVFLLAALALSQKEAGGAPSGNFLKNSRFEEFTSSDNLWAGVDGSDLLTGNTIAVDAILESGRVWSLPMPVSVQVADLNGDGLPDIFMVDGYGYMRVYFNSGTKAEPKFTTCEIVPAYFRRLRLGAVWSGVPNAFHGCLADFGKRGVLDIVCGNYLGKVLLLKNTGTIKAPEWHPPAKSNDVFIPTTKDNHLWANLLAPLVYDWNGDGKLDLLLGEGSYSANSIHLLLNKGSNSAPKFDEESRDYLAFGEGREQLVPAVVDWNGDGLPDLLVGDRNGAISLYLAKAPWKKGAQLEAQPTPVQFGKETSIGQGPAGARCVAPAVADLNGDGLFDIIIGRSDGRIAVAYNIGTKTEPKFGPPVLLKGENPFKKQKFDFPKDWDVNFGVQEGNFYGYHACVTPAEDPEAAGSTSPRVLKFAYSPVLNKIIRKPPLAWPSPEEKNEMMKYDTHFGTNSSAACWYCPIWGCGYFNDSNTVIIRQHIGPGFLKPLSNFKLSFKVKGRGVKDARLRFTMQGWLIHDTKKDSKTTGNYATESVNQDEEFTVTPSWTTVTRTVNIRFEKEADLNMADRWKATGRSEFQGILQIYSNVDPDTGVLYIDDVEMSPM